MTLPLDIQTWSTAPRVHVIDDFVSDTEIAHVLRLAEHPEQLAPGLTTTRSEAGLSFEMPVGEDPVLNAIRDRMTALIGFGNDLGDTFRFRRYAPGEYHPPHVDAFSAGGTDLIVTALLDLVAPDEGGDTFFPLAADGPLAVPHRRGRLVVWYNHTHDGAVDRLSTHEGLRVTKGEKTTLTAFVYKPTYYAASPFPAPPAAPRTEHAVVVHAGGDPDARQAWVNAAEWVGYAVSTHDARTDDALPSDALLSDALLLPVDFSLPVRRVLFEQYQPGWTSVFTDRPRVCLDAPLYLARHGLPVRTETPDTARQWIAVVGDTVVGPEASAVVRALAVRAVHALKARTGIVWYDDREAGAEAIVEVSAPASLESLPTAWWSPFCLAVLQHLRTTASEPVIDGAASPRFDIPEAAVDAPELQPA